MVNNFSKIGFMLATLGSSVGLGHIWRFPYIAGTNGGGLFVLLYLFLALGIGIAMLIGEMLIGNKGQANVFKSYEKLDPSPNKRWRFAGLTLIGGPIILSFYAIVLGWVFYYLFFVSFSLPTDMEVSKANFDRLYSQNFIAQTMGLMLVLGISGLVIARGVKKGIELLNLILTPTLFLIFLGLLFYAMSMDSFPKALHFVLGFEWEQAKKALSLSIFIDSLGQVFFSLSLGIGIIITYAASSDSAQNLFKSAFFIVLSGIIIAIMAGLMIFTFVYEYGGEVDGGVGLVFKTLPVMFAHLGFLGNIIAFLFLVAFSFAGITSAISLLEPSVMYIVEHYKISRFRATWSMVGVIFILGLMIVCSLCTPLASYLTFGNKSLMDIVEFLSANIIMTLGGLFAVIFVGWVMPETTLYDFTAYFFSRRAFEAWYIVMRYIAPFITIMILIAVSIDFFRG